MSRKHRPQAPGVARHPAPFTDQNAPAPPAVQAAGSAESFPARPSAGAAAPKLEAASPAPPKFAPPAMLERGAVSPEPTGLEAPAPLLTKLLHIADMYRAEDSIRQAMSIYFELAEEHSGTPEAYDALERLLEIAKNYEDAGEIRQARSLYERLL